jgi:outer membrane protein assembly factor BamB
VFVGGDGLIEARAQADGRAQWRRPVKGRIALLYWDTGWLVAATETGPIFALRATDGEILWQRDLDSPLSAPPAPAAERLYLALKDGRILALSLTTGDDIWMHKLTESAVGLPTSSACQCSTNDGSTSSPSTTSCAATIATAVR